MKDGLKMLGNVDEYIISALKEDVTFEDITTMAIVEEAIVGKCDLIAKEDGVIAGTHVFTRVYELIGGVVVNFSCEEGDYVKKGQVLASLKGEMRSILIGERTALNFFQRMSGIATMTKQYADVIKDLNTKILDTRKTTPNMRIFEKYSVKVGGGCNHRFNLSDGVLIKDNHIGAAGSIAKAVERARSYNSFVRKIEVEVENLEMVKEALESKADIIMLDNMSLEDMKAAVKLIDRRALTEASGNVNLERLRAIAETGVDYVSVGALTHSAKILDVSLKNLKPIY